MRGTDACQPQMHQIRTNVAPINAKHLSKTPWQNRLPTRSNAYHVCTLINSYSCFCVWSQCANMFTSSKSCNLLLLLPSLFGKDLSADSQHPFKTFSSFYSILPKSFHSDLLDTILDLLPTATKCCYPCRLVECGHTRNLRRSVHDRFLHR